MILGCINQFVNPDLVGWGQPIWPVPAVPVLKTLTEIVERFGGSTGMSEAREDEMS
jgi:hypothetical protein